MRVKSTKNEFDNYNNRDEGFEVIVLHIKQTSQYYWVTKLLTLLWLLDNILMACLSNRWIKRTYLYA